jgi:16S rRNA (uracil1498-N3)-methyltransferase
MSQRFYVNCPLALGPVRIEGPEAHHLTHVCRLRPGDSVCLFNGDGQEYSAVVVARARNGVELNVLTVKSPVRELPQRLEVAAPLPKGDRGQFLLEKLTELGVAAFVPLRTARSVVHPGETRLEKLQRYVIEASKQCGRNVLMPVAPVTPWQDYCTRHDGPPTRLVAHPGSADELAAMIGPQSPGLALAVGPEGGFTEEEISLAQSHGWRAVSLGPRLLRIETAAIALAARFALDSS